MMTLRDHGTADVGAEPAVAGSFVAGLAAQDFGALGGWFTVEQQAYADTDESGRIARLDLLCTGYRPEGNYD
jgi:hypothetical protein